MTKPVLYSYYRSSCSWRVRAALEFKGIPYDIEAVNLVKDGGQQHTEDYKNINPMAQVPALKIDGTELIQSMAIIEYLEETRPNPNLLPKDPVARSKVRIISECISSGIQPLQNTGILQKIGNERKTAWAKDVIQRGFDAVEKILKAYAGKYCVGDSITFADCCLVPQVYNANRFGVDLKPYPLIKRINDTLMQHEAFIKSHPSNQPDCPPEDPKL